VKNDFLPPIIVLSLICFVIAGALAFTNSFTEPVIEAAARQRTETAFAEMIPDADNFEILLSSGYLGSVREIYKSSNDVGYIFIAQVNGYGGEIRIICGVSPDGKIIRSSVLEHSETKGLGSKIADAPFSSQFSGIDESRLSEVDAVTGATISTNAYISAISDVFTAFDLIMGVR